jgi:shikimate 5-dehydrogenase
VNAQPSSATVWFLGVSTGQSAIHRLLPVWRDQLGVDATVVGRDLPLGPPAEAYLRFLDDLQNDDRAIGAIVTSHKVGLLEAAGTQFAAIEPVARLLGEANAIRRGPNGPEAFARDNRALRRTMDESIDPDQWDNGADLLCFGIGGSSRALLLASMTESGSGSPPFALRASRPRVFHAVGRNRRRLDEFAMIARAAGIPPESVELHTMTSEEANGKLLTSLPTGSLIVNATGLGKDAPGSPIPTSVDFPQGAVIWDFNYRGDLRFLDHAGSAVAARALDGWLYFLHGWTEALAPLLDRSLDDEAFARLAAVSEPFRPRGSRVRVAPGLSSPGAVAHRPEQG